MDILVHQFKVRYKGQDYGPGSVIQGVADEEGKSLIAGSNGELAELPSRGEASQESAPAADAAELPKVDPAKTVK